MRENVACFTGHRFIPNAELPHLIPRLDETVACLIDQGVKLFLSGGAIGWDLLGPLPF